MTNSKPESLLEETIDIVEKVSFLREISKANGILDRKSFTDIEQELSKHEVAAKAIAEIKSIKKNVCVGVTKAADNIKELAKIVIASVLPLSLSGLLHIQVTPMLLAAVIFIIIDSGFAMYCKDI